MSEQAPAGSEVKPVDSDGFPDVPELKGGTDADFQRDIKQIQEETGMTVGTSEPPAVDMSNLSDDQQQESDESDTPEPAATEKQDQPPAETKDKRYDKFRDESGEIDVEKVKQSTEAALSKAEEEAQALAQYEAAVKEMHKTSAERRQVEAAAPDAGEGFSTLAEQFNAELSKPNANIGEVMAKVVLAAANHASAQAGQATQGEIADLRLQAKLNADRSELENIAKTDSWVLSKQGYEALAKIRQEKPHLQNWSEAYEIAAFRRSKATSGSVRPNPKSKGVPAAPPSGARKVQQRKRGLDTSNKEELFKRLDKMTPEQEAQAWREAGLNV